MLRNLYNPSFQHNYVLQFFITAVYFCQIPQILLAKGNYKLKEIIIHDTPEMMGTPSVQVLVPKYHLPLKRTRAVEKD